MVVTLASAALVIPYLLFSPLAGRLAKIYKKRKIVVWAKFAEMLIMVVAAAFDRVGVVIYFVDGAAECVIFSLEVRVDS